MSTLLIIHICAVSFWFGVVGAETIIERSRSENKEHGYAVARNHFFIDMFLEIPVAAIVLVSGLLMLNEAHLSSPLFILKIIAGMFAVGINAACVIPVTRRKNAANKGQLDEVIRHSGTIDKISILGIPAGVLALSIGIFT